MVSWNGFRRLRRRRHRGTDRADERSVASAGERRQLTVKFVDLVGSTQMAEEHEPEVVRDVLRRYHEVCARAIEEHHGYTARYEGDGVLAYFGYPAAREDDALQGVLAGLDLLAGLEAAASSVMEQFGIPLEARVGVHTGLVLVTELGTPGSEVSDAVIGAAPNEAARL